MSKSLEKRIEEAIDTSLEDTSTSLGERRKLKRNILKQVRQDRREEEEEETGVSKDLTRRKFLKMLGIGTGGLALSSSAAGLFKITDQPQTSTINADTVDGKDASQLGSSNANQVDGFDIQKNGTDQNGVINFNTTRKTVTIDGKLISGTAPIPDSGVARWTLDSTDTVSGTAVDVWNENDGTINGATTGVNGADQTYATNEAYSFDGTGDYVEIPHDDSLQPQAITVSAWINANVFDKNHSILCKYQQAGADSWDFRPKSDGAIQFTLGGGNQLVSNTTLSTGEWHHVAATYDGSTIIIYIDGVDDASTQNSGGILTNTDYVSIGAGYDIGDGNRHFNGDIDDPRIYSRALTSTEVSNIYQTGSIFQLSL